MKKYSINTFERNKKVEVYETKMTNVMILKNVLFQ